MITQKPPVTNLAIVVCYGHITSIITRKAIHNEIEMRAFKHEVKLVTRLRTRMAKKMGKANPIVEVWELKQILYYGAPNR